MAGSPDSVISIDLLDNRVLTYHSYCITLANANN